MTTNWHRAQTPEPVALAAAGGLEECAAVAEPSAPLDHPESPVGSPQEPVGAPEPAESPVAPEEAPGECQEARHWVGPESGYPAPALLTGKLQESARAEEEREQGGAIKAAAELLATAGLCPPVPCDHGPERECSACWVGFLEGSTADLEGVG